MQNGTVQVFSPVAKKEKMPVEKAVGDEDVVVEKFLQVEATPDRFNESSEDDIDHGFSINNGRIVTVTPKSGIQTLTVENNEVTVDGNLEEFTTHKDQKICV